MMQNIFTYKSKRYDEQDRNCLVKVVIVGFLFVLLPLSICAQENERDTRPAASVWYEELAAQGDVDAKYNLGMMNETGWSVPVDINKAIRWYREAAKQGHAEAQVRLGMLYYLGLGAKQSKLKGESWIRKAAKQGHGFAQSLNKNLFKQDVPDTLNQNSVLKEVRKIYLQDEAKATNRLHRLIDDAKRKSTTQQQAKEETTIRERREIRVVAGTSNVEAVKASDKPVSPKVKTPAKKKELERIESVVPEFIEKKSLEENRTLARGNINTIRLQAKKGLASAQYNLGRMYELGVKVPVDRKQALEWYKKAAAQGYADAQYRMAISMLYGKSEEHDERLGRKWLSSAAGNGHQIAQSLLAKLTNEEGSFETSNSLAVGWYLERAIAGNAEAAISLGKIFEFGWGAAPNLREAIKWYQHALTLGSSDAEDLLRDSKVQLAQIKEGIGEAGDISESLRPPDWVAYLLAASLAIGIIFWPMLKRGRNTGIDVVQKKITKEDPPF